jgi:hypothetical protein
MIEMKLFNIIGKDLFHINKNGFGEDRFGKTVVSRIWFAHLTGGWADKQIVPFEVGSLPTKINIKESSYGPKGNYTFSRPDWSWKLKPKGKNVLFFLEDGSMAFNLQDSCLLEKESRIQSFSAQTLFYGSIGTPKTCMGLMNDIVSWWYLAQRKEPQENPIYKEYAESYPIFLNLVRCFYPDFEIEGPPVRTDLYELHESFMLICEGRKTLMLYAPKKMKEILLMAYSYVFYQNILKQRINHFDLKISPSIDQIIWDRESYIPDISKVSETEIINFHKYS